MEPTVHEKIMSVDYSYKSNNNNGTDENLAEVLYWASLISSIADKGIIPFGLLMNGIFLFVVVRVRAMHTAVNIHLSNLAVADMFFLLYIVFLQITLMDTFGSMVVMYIPYLASMLFVTVVAVGRCFAIYYPFRARAGATKCRAVKVAIGVWICSVLLSVTYNLVSHCNCVDPLIMDIVYLLINPIFLIINIVFYVFVLVGLYKRKQISTSLISQRRMVKMLVVNTTIFFAFHIAVTTFNFYAMFNTMEFSTGRIGRAVIFMLLFLNSSINPLVYGATNADYRAAFVSAFSCEGCACIKSREPESQSNYIEVDVLNRRQSEEQTQFLQD